LYGRSIVSRFVDLPPPRHAYEWGKHRHQFLCWRLPGLDSFLDHHIVIQLGMINKSECVGERRHGRSRRRSPWVEMEGPLFLSTIGLQKNIMERITALNLDAHALFQFVLVQLLARLGGVCDRFALYASQHVAYTQAGLSDN